MSSFELRDIFTDKALARDPYGYFDRMRAEHPVYHVEDRNLMLVTGYEECKQVLADEALYSAITGSAGPATPLPFVPEGDDVNAQLEAHRHEMPLHDMVTSMDGQAHRNARGLLNKLFVPSRLKANEDYMASLADRMTGEIVAKGSCELIDDVATPFVTLVIADLMGVPAADRDRFAETLAGQPPLFDLDDPDRKNNGRSGFMEMGTVVYGYFEDRRANPRDDILTQIVHSSYPDGTTPNTVDLVKIVMTLFGAGQDTSAKLLANGTRVLCEDQALQQTLREDPSLMAPFLEEMMRMEGSVKMTSRMATRKTTLGGVDIPAGQVCAVIVAAANRDPRRFEEPLEFRLKRPKAAEHLGFGRGSHVCIGAPLARAEVRIFLNTLLAKTKSIRISEAHHGPTSARRLDYVADYAMRGLRKLFVEFEAGTSK